MSEERENVSLSASAVCPDEGRFPTLAELQVGLGSGGKIREFLENKKKLISSFILQEAQHFLPA